MPKFMYTQSSCVLLDAPVSREQLAEVLTPFRPEPQEFVADDAEGGTGGWAWGSQPAVRIARGAGLVVVDVVPRRWPDEMGGKETEEGPYVFGAWATQQFGPFAWPGGLERAATHTDWDGAAEAVDRHRAFVRIRSVHLGSAAGGEDAYDAFAELMLATMVADSLLDLPGALAYFNPNGEALHGRDRVRGLLEEGLRVQFPPHPIWCNVRGMNLADGWVLLDTVGNAQLDLPDLEACVPLEGFDAEAVRGYLGSMTDYLIRNGDVINDGDTGQLGEKVCRIRRFAQPLSDPPRPVLCAVPLDAGTPPDFVLNRPEPELAAAPGGEGAGAAGPAAPPDAARRGELAEAAREREQDLSGLVDALRAEGADDNPLPPGHPAHTTNQVEIGKKNMAFRANKTQVLREAEVLEGARIAVRSMLAIGRMPPPRPADQFYVRCATCRCLLPVKATVALRCDCGAVAFSPDGGGWTVPPAPRHEIVEPHGIGSIRPEPSKPAAPAPPPPAAPAKSPSVGKPERPWWKLWG